MSLKCEKQKQTNKHYYIVNFGSVMIQTLFKGLFERLEKEHVVFPNNFILTKIWKIQNI